MPRVGFDMHMPARQLTLAQVGGILEFAPAQPVAGKKRVHVSDNTRNGRRAPALAARPPRGRATPTAAHGRNGRHAVATAAQQDGAAAVGGQGKQPKVEVQETPVVQPVQQVVATPHTPCLGYLDTCPRKYTLRTKASKDQSPMSVTAAASPAAASPALPWLQSVCLVAGDH